MISNFLIEEIFIRKLATVNKDAGPHIVPIQFVLDNEDKNNNIDIIVTTNSKSLKAAKNILHDPRVTILNP